MRIINIMTVAVLAVLFNLGFAYGQSRKPATVFSVNSGAWVDAASRMRSDGRRDARFDLDMKIDREEYETRKELLGEYVDCVKDDSDSARDCSALRRAIYDFDAISNGGYGMVDPAWKAGVIINSAYGVQEDWAQNIAIHQLDDRTRDNKVRVGWLEDESFENQREIARVERESQVRDKMIDHDIMSVGKVTAGTIKTDKKRDASLQELRKGQAELERQIEELKRSKKTENEKE